MTKTSTQSQSDSARLHEEVAELRASVDRLKQGSDKWKVAAVVSSSSLALLLFVAIIIVIGRDGSDEIAAEAFHVVNDGKTVAILDSVFDGGGRLKLFDRKGRYSATPVEIKVDNGDGWFTTRNSAGGKIVSIIPTVDGDGSIETYHRNGNVLVAIGNVGRDVGTITTRNAQGARLISLSTAGQSGYGWLGIHGPDDSDLIRMGAIGDDNPAGFISTRNANGENLISLSRGSQAGYGWLDIHGPNDTDMIRMGALGDENPSGYISTHNSTGDRLISLNRGSQSGYGWLGIHGPDDSDLIRMGASGNENPAGWIGTYDVNGNALTFLGRTTTGNGFIETYRSDGQDLVTLTSTASGKGVVSVHRNDDVGSGEKSASRVVEGLSQDGQYDVIFAESNEKDGAVVGLIQRDTIKFRPDLAQKWIDIPIEQIARLELSSDDAKLKPIRAKMIFRNDTEMKGTLGVTTLQLAPQHMSDDVWSVHLRKVAEIHLGANRDRAEGG